MEMMNVMYELATTKTALELAEKTIRKQKGKLLRRNILIAGLAWLGFTACRMLGESDEKLKKVEAKARDTEAELAMMHHNYDQQRRRSGLSDCVRKSYLLRRHGQHYEEAGINLTERRKSIHHERFLQNRHPPGKAGRNGDLSEVHRR